MINPNMPNIPGMPGFPGMGAMTDTLEFVKNLWGSMGIPGLNMSSMNMPGIPGMVVPTLSVEEIRKKVSDLRAVETWLELNMNLLRGTIQALEVQAATLSTLQSMGNALSATVSSTSGLGAGAQQSPASSSSASFSAESPRSGHSAQSGQQQASPRSASTDAAPSSRDEADAATLTAPLVNAAAWWNMLQDQFRQAVNNAMVQEMPAMQPAAPAQKAKSKSDSKSSARGDSKGNSDSGASTTRRRRSSK